MRLLFPCIELEMGNKGSSVQTPTQSQQQQLQQSSIEASAASVPQENSTASSTTTGDDDEEWRERCTVITRQDHEEYVNYANQFLKEIIDSLPVRTEGIAKLEVSPSNQVGLSVTLASPGDKQDSHSVCSSTDYTHSDSSFDTAREDFHQSLPDLVLLPETIRTDFGQGLDTDRSDTDYESATDLDDTAHSIFNNTEVLSSDSVLTGRNLFNVIHSAASSSGKNGLVTNFVYDCPVPFDRESTPVVDGQHINYEEEEEEVVPSLNLPSSVEDLRLSLFNVSEIDNKVELKDKDCVETAEDQCLLVQSSPVVDDNCNFVTPSSVLSPRFDAEEEKKTEESVQEIVSQQLLGAQEEEGKTEERKNTEEEVVDGGAAAVPSQVVESVENPEEHSLISEESDKVEKEVTEKKEKKEEEESEILDLKSGKLTWQSSVNNCQPKENLSVEIVDECKDQLKDVEENSLVEQLQLEATVIAEELINISLREQLKEEEEIEDEVDEEEGKNMKDKMADAENNEPTKPETVELDGPKTDENVNVVQSSKSKMSNSSSASRAKVKNGEVAPHDSAQNKKSSPVNAKTNSNSVRPTNSASPKRKGSDTSTTKVAKEKETNQDEKADENDSAVFKKPLPKTTTTTTTASSRSSNKSTADSTSQEEVENSEGSKSPGIMMRSVESDVISEAGPDVAEFSDQEFKSAAEVFKDPAAFDFLQMAGSKHLSESALARMSLYVKFDPLLKAISPVAKRTLSKTSTSDQSQMSTNSDGSDDLLLLGTPKDGSTEGATTPGSKNSVVEGRLLDLTPSPHKRQNESGWRVYSEEEFSQALRMQELLFQEQLLKKDREWDEKIKPLDKELQEAKDRLRAFLETHEEMKVTVVEYEKTISQLIDDREKEKQMTGEQMKALRMERDQALEHLQNVETSFADLHRRYEKSKMAVEGFKKNEEVLKSYVKEGQNTIKKKEQKYELLKHHAEETLSCANQEIEALKKSSEAETAALRALLKKSEMKIESLEKTLAQRDKENSELSNICDELIAKVGHGNS